GGAGGQHACLVADALGIRQVLLHPFAGVLSAYGMGLADITAMREKAVEARLADELMPRLERELADMERDAVAELQRQDVAADRITAHRRVHVRYEGTDTPLVVPYGSRAEIVAAFEAAHRQQYGFVDEHKHHI